MDPFVAEIRIFAFNFPPKGWATCDGQLADLTEHRALLAARHHVRRRWQVDLGLTSAAPRPMAAGTGPDGEHYQARWQGAPRSR